MKAYRVTMLIIDHDQLGEDEIQVVIENAKYPNHCISPQVKAIEARDIGEWHDDHPLNKADEHDGAYEKLFS